jgi:late-transcription coactivator
MTQLNNPTEDLEFDRLFIDHPLYELTPQSFSLEIEKLVKEQNMNYLEAVAALCERFEIEFTATPRLLTDTMKEKIEVDAMNRNLFRKHKASVQPTPAEFFVDIEE